MKPITINDKTFYYKVTNYRSGQYFEYFYEETSFFSSPTITITRKKYDLGLFDWGFGPMITEEIENKSPLFKIPIDVTDPKYSKEKVKKEVEEGYRVHQRTKEIANNEII